MYFIDFYEKSMVLTGIVAFVLLIGCGGNRDKKIIPTYKSSSEDLSLIKDLGEPIHRYQALGSAIGPGTDGRPQAYFMIRGNATTQTEFAVIDLRSQEIVFDDRLPRGHSSGRTMDYSSVDGNVYFGMGDIGELYRYNPKPKQIESLGVPLEAQRIWGLHVASDGTVWGGTYPGGRVFSYDPETGEVHDYGQAIENQQYVHGLVQAGDVIYVGTGNQPNTQKLARLDPRTGEFTTIPLPEEYDERAGTIKDLYVRNGLLLVRYNAELFIYDSSKGEWVDHMEEFSGRGISPVDSSIGSTIYFRIKSGCLVRYNLKTLSYTKTKFCPDAFPEKIEWIDMNDSDYPGQTLALTYWRHARIYVHNFESHEGYYLQPDVMGAGAQLTELGAGPNGKIYAGGYLSPPGMGRWDPGRETWTLLRGASQVEGYGTFKEDLLFGIYPTGSLYRYDSDQSWDPGVNPEEPVVIGHEQNRSQTFVDLGDQVAVGSVPKPGRLGGAITLWNPETGHLQVFRNVISGQTPVSLTFHDGLIYGGTSIHGGYGTEPSTSEAHLFIWDPETHKTLFQTVPLPGATYVAGLAVDNLGHLWGLTGNSIFEFDPKDQKVLRTKQLFDDDDMASVRYGSDQELVFVEGQLFGVAGNRLFRFDTTSWQVEVLHTGDSLDDLAVDRDGDLYYVFNGSHVYRYDRSE